MGVRLMKRRYRSYVKCKNCGLNIRLPFECRFMYPLHFSATCHNCGHTDVYHRLEVIQENDEHCQQKLEKVEKRIKPLQDAVTQYLLHSIVYTTTQTLIETLSTLKQLGGYRGEDQVTHVSNIPNIMKNLKNPICPEEGGQRNSSTWK